MWYALLAVVCLIIGYWIGHYVGFEDFRADVKARLSIPPERQRELTQNVFWTYRHVLGREPSPDEVREWERHDWPLRQVVDVFLNSREFKSRSQEHQRRVLQAVDRHFIQSERRRDAKAPTKAAISSADTRAP
jgi:hypothetical protein